MAGTDALYHLEEKEVCPHSLSKTFKVFKSAMHINLAIIFHSSKINYNYNNIISIKRLIKLALN